MSTYCSYVDAAPRHIPALIVINKTRKAKFFCIHFHGNACDIAQIAICAEKESKRFDANYLIVEFPRYGIALGHPNELVMNEMAKSVYYFVVNELGIDHSRIVIIGRSIGVYVA
jgi:hypothetical protein